MEGRTDVPRQRRPAVVIAQAREDDPPRFQNLVVRAFREWSREPDEPPVVYRAA
ncbi:hypothetical protein [Actinophytocola xinjiangensis]|uniref:hypothetical protein n=1 Tax=Actinophytocola xinjiangensis TaxID=485602 RepID=UPI000A76DE7D|nr:hypothetical protein [Actinophytocola xinjiangensis]